MAISGEKKFLHSDKIIAVVSKNFCKDYFDLIELFPQTKCVGVTDFEYILYSDYPLSEADDDGVYCFQIL